MPSDRQGAEEAGDGLFSSAPSPVAPAGGEPTPEILTFLPAGLIDKIFSGAAGLTVLAMMFMTLRDVVGRYFFSAPLGYAFEMTQVGMATVFFLALPCVTLRSQHVTAGLFENLFRGRAAHLRDAVLLGVAAVSLAFVAMRLLRLADRFHNYGERTSVLHLPVAWPAWLGVVCLGVSAFCAAAMAMRALWRGIRG